MKEIFIDNPNLDVVYQTSDGKFFYTLNDAEIYSQNLEDKKVKKIERFNDDFQSDNDVDEVALEDRDEPSKNEDSGDKEIKKVKNNEWS